MSEQNNDIFSQYASKIFNVPATGVTEHQRRYAKSALYQQLYNYIEYTRNIGGSGTLTQFLNEPSTIAILKITADVEVKLLYNVPLNRMLTQALNDPLTKEK